MIELNSTQKNIPGLIQICILPHHFTPKLSHSKFYKGNSYHLLKLIWHNHDKANFNIENLKGKSLQNKPGRKILSSNHQDHDNSTKKVYTMVHLKF